MNEYNLSETDLSYLKSLIWEYKDWKPSPALVDKNGFASNQYVGQKYDPNSLTVDKEGWTHDHCEVCWTRLCINKEECETSGYNSANQWLCNSCYNRFIK